jgi:hypothetical protein
MPSIRISRGREAAGQPLEGVRHPQAGGVVEPLADDHHPDREAVRQARRDTDGRVAADVERRRVGDHLQRAGDLDLARV